MKHNKNIKISNEMSIYLRFLHHEKNMSCMQIKQRFPKYALRSIHRHCKKLLPVDQPVVDKRKQNKGRPRKLTSRDERNVVRAISKLRKKQAAFTAKKIREEAGIVHASTRTVCRMLNKHGYHYCQARKKGLLNKSDKAKRLEFARKAKTFSDDFWERNIAFYFDGVGFGHKSNPHGEARATSTMTWRKPKEGLQRTTKGKKEGSGGRMAHFFVGISHQKGVVLCERYECKLTGESFATFVRRKFPAAFIASGKADCKTFLQDGDPRQVSKAAKNAMIDIGCDMFAIPPRSPDLNPIENIFHQVRKQLKDDALQLEITRENYEQFYTRVQKTLKEFSVDFINKTIESMNRRIDMVIKTKGERTKY